MPVTFFIHGNRNDADRAVHIGWDVYNRQGIAYAYKDVIYEDSIRVAGGTKAPDYGIVQLYLDGEKLGGPLDLYHTAVVPSGPLVMGACTLAAGEHKLRIEILGANEKALKAYMFGLDYVKLDPIRYRCVSDQGRMDR